MSLMDKLKSMFAGGSSDATHDHSSDDHSDHDHSSHDHSHDPVAPPMPPADPAGMPTSEPSGGDEHKPA